MIITAVGSYPKISPQSIAPNLRTALSQVEAGRLTEVAFHHIEEQNTREVILEQAAAGLDLLTDGQIRREDGQTYFARRIKGFSINGLTRYFDTNTYYRQPVAETKLEWAGPISVKDFSFAAACSAKPMKAVVTGPYTLARLSHPACYADLRTLALDMASILNQEALALQEAGATFIQFDEPAIVRHKDEIGLLEEASRIVTEGVTAKSAVYTWFGDVDGIAERFFRMPFQVFGLDFVMGEGNWRAIEALPNGKELAAGIVDARNTRLEPVEQVVEAIVHLSYYLPRGRLYLNPSAGLEYLPRQNAQAKLARLAESGRRAQEMLWHE
ncbi:MAG: methylcobamide--CoM methyltransferase [Chloroflexota bacterium]|nr:methylcobamide--CoM methyltransferase [Chloroflexota bacterium]